MVLENYRVSLVSLVIVVELLTSWEVVLEQFVAVAFKLLDAFSRAVWDRFVRVAVQIILTQQLVGLAINVLNVNLLGVRRVDNRNRWSLFGIAVGTALYYRFAWRVAGNRWRSQGLVALAGFVPLAPSDDARDVVQDTIPRKRYLSRLIFSGLSAISILVANRFRQRLRTLRAVS